jgi:hypothetical protein
VAPHVVIVAAAWCSFVNPAVDKAAGLFPKFLPLAVAVTVSDIACVAILHVPTASNILGILSDVGTVVTDLPKRRTGR